MAGTVQTSVLRRKLSKEPAANGNNPVERSLKSTETVDCSSVHNMTGGLLDLEFGSDTKYRSSLTEYIREDPNRLHQRKGLRIPFNASSHSEGKDYDLASIIEYFNPLSRSSKHGPNELIFKMQGDVVFTCHDYTLLTPILPSSDAKRHFENIIFVKSAPATTASSVVCFDG